FPGHQKGERVVGQNDQRHAGEKRGVERQDPLRRSLVAAVAEREQTGARGAEIDHGQEEGGKRIKAQMRAEPGQSDRKRQTLRRSRSEELRQRGRQRNNSDDNARAIDEAARRGRAPDDDRKDAERDQETGADEDDRQCHVAGLFSRTPRPPPELTALSVMSSIPSESSAAMSFISESTLPRTTPSLASMRWMVGSDSPAASASVR